MFFLHPASGFSRIVSSLHEDIESNIFMVCVRQNRFITLKNRFCRKWSVFKVAPICTKIGTRGKLRVLITHVVLALAKNRFIDGVHP